jgi:hypothetical protein
MIDWSKMKPVREPTRKERGRYQRWVKYLKDSKLSEQQIHERAARLAEQGREPDL